jgi:hypothetical protein
LRLLYLIFSWLVSWLTTLTPRIVVQEHRGWPI